MGANRDIRRIIGTGTKDRSEHECLYIGLDCSVYRTTVIVIFSVSVMISVIVMVVTAATIQ